MPKRESSTESLIEKDLELVKDGLRVVTATFGLTLYTGEIFSSIPKVILECFDRYRSLCPESEMKFYGTENMRRHKPVTKRTLSILPTWLKPGAPPREYIMLEIQNGDAYQEAPTFKFLVFGGEKTSITYKVKSANIISMAFPAAWGLTRTEEMFNLMRELCELFPFQSGHAGFSLECSTYEVWSSQGHAWATSMRHHGLDIFRADKIMRAAGRNALVGVNWLTALDNKLVKKVGGQAKLRRKLSSAIDLIDLPGGLIIRAGKKPRIGDTNHNDLVPEYQEVFSALETLIEPAIERYGCLTVWNDASEKTNAWLRRFAT